MATDGKGAYREAMLQIWGKVPQYSGKGRPAPLPKPDKDWHYLQVVKKRKGSRLVSVHIKVVYGDPEEVKAMIGAHTASVEQRIFPPDTHEWAARRKTLSFPKNSASWKLRSVDGEDARSILPVESSHYA